MPNEKQKKALGRVVARRELTVFPGGPQVIVNIGLPRPHPKGDWGCCFLIEGLGKPILKNALGVDALQALILAIQGARVTLDETGLRFSWLEADPDRVSTGIPNYVPTDLGPQAESRISIAIEREAKRHFQTILNGRKANLAVFEAEIRQRRKLLDFMEAQFAERKAGQNRWQAELDDWKPEETARISTAGKRARKSPR